ncbi:MAG: NAD(P)H-hydrate epimerase [Gordonibacter sp.]|uniref:NAD(P)H-hydrate epimerase n=1 Tax=Gordonibacter sp. TaxID=1968902 RepID=UPI002FC778F1
MSGYVSNIVVGFLTFPLIAAVITLPYMVYQYRKFGSIPWLRSLIVYSFVFYMLVAYYMVILPLPEDHSAIVPYAATPQLAPFNFVRLFLEGTTVSLSDPSTWKGLLHDPNVYEALFNVLLLVPLGMYLRYYFRRTWWQALLIGFATTLFYELSQLTGLWGIYEHPYRLFDVDDLILNTLGAMVGFWLVGPALRALPDIRLVNEEAREAGVRASVTRRALSFLVDFAVAGAVAALALLAARVLGAPETLAASGVSWMDAQTWANRVSLLAFFVVAPTLTHGQTLGQKLLRLRIVRHDVSPAHWYHYLARYGLLYLFAIVPFAALSGIVGLDPSNASEMGAVSAFVANHQQGLVVAWLVFMGAWALSLVVRAVRAALKKCSFVMLNGLLSNTRVMTEEGVRIERERRAVLDVGDVGKLERLIAADGTSMAELMDRAGHAVADEVRAHVPDPAPVVVLTGTGNNGGDGWVAALELAQAGYPVTLVAPDLAERLSAEPARTAAQDAFAAASEQGVALRVLIAPDTDILNDAIDKAAAIVDALLGTGFSGNEVREPFASWIRAANRRRFEGDRGRGQGRHRKRTHERGEHERPLKTLPNKVKHAPVALAVDVPSGLSAQTGTVGHPTFCADRTVTMLAFKPGLVAASTTPWTGGVKLAKLGVDVSAYRAKMEALAEPGGAE